MYSRWYRWSLNLWWCRQTALNGLKSCRLDLLSAWGLTGKQFSAQHLLGALIT